MLSPKKNKTFTIYSGHIIIMGHNYGQEAQISQKNRNVSSLYF